MEGRQGKWAGHSRIKYVVHIHTLPPSLPPSFSDQYDPFSVGRSDLDPFGYVRMC